jgi:hypothetical protein
MKNKLWILDIAKQPLALLCRCFGWREGNQSDGSRRNQGNRGTIISLLVECEGMIYVVLFTGTYLIL